MKRRLKASTAMPTADIVQQLTEPQDCDYEHDHNRGLVVNQIHVHAGYHSSFEPMVNLEHGVLLDCLTTDPIL